MSAPPVHDPGRLRPRGVKWTNSYWIKCGSIFAGKTQPGLAASRDGGRSGWSEGKLELAGQGGPLGCHGSAESRRKARADWTLKLPSVRLVQSEVAESLPMETVRRTLNHLNSSPG